ncbi:MAG TPA: hypothetical protein VFX49_06605 [Chloroflexota bacterium]|nr:hypothetical protein [Chloroflexota bacterium]
MGTMEGMDRTGRVHIQPGMDVFDVDAHKIGSVVHLHERSGGGPASPGGYTVEVKTGFLGLGKHYFIPQSAVKDVTEGGVFLNASRDTAKHAGWETRPADLGAAPHQEMVRPAQEHVSSASAASTWDEASPGYRSRFLSRYGADASWQRYEPRYRFAWEMRQAADLRDRRWSEAEAELRQRWEVLHPADPWEGASEVIRDVWEGARTTA